MSHPLNDLLILDWQQAAAAGASLVGGKGWNLGRLQRYGFPVPAGGVIAASVYEQFISAALLADQTAALAQVNAEATLQASVGDELARLQQTIEATPLPAPTVEAIQKFLACPMLNGVPLAVRSSATAEDSQAASFAGIHSSFLNVRGTDEVLRAVTGCYASLWTAQALAYRRRLNFADREVACAVVICAMVQGPDGGPPQSAGVAFSCDPRTGQRNRLTISAVSGLGEALVSGHVNPEEIAVLLKRGYLHIIERKGGMPATLTEEQVLELARLVLRVHWSLGEGQVPQDVEWAFDGRRFWLVQARPVTRLPRPTCPAVAHLPVIWSNANLKDILPGAHRTLGWNLINTTVRNIAWASLEAVGYPVPLGMESTRRFAGRAYFDLTALQWAFYDAFGMLPSETNRGLGGHQPEIPLPSGSPFRGWRGCGRFGNRLRLLRKLLGLPRRLPLAIERLQAAVRQAKSGCLADLPEAELLPSIYHLRDELLAYSDTYQFSIVNASVWVGALEGVLRRVAPERAQSLTAGLMGGSGQMTSAEHGSRVLDLVESARHDPAARAYLEQAPRDPNGWQELPAESPFRAAVAHYLEQFGHRSVYEMVLENPRWNEDPSYLLEQVRLLLAIGSGPDVRRSAEGARHKAEHELTRLSFWARPVVRRLAARARQAVVLREEGKSALVSLMEPTRYLFLEVGRRLTAAGALQTPTDLFHLSWPDVESYLRGEWTGAGARPLVEDRKAVFAQWLTQSPPDVLILDAEGQPAALPVTAVSAKTTDSVAARDGRQLAGIGVSTGRVTGIARVIRHPSESGHLGSQEILVAPSTDPGWTPLFLRASAIVMEVGGYLSHGAIVAREYGLPAVVNIPGLLDAVRDGQRITVDGELGLVFLEEES